MPAVPQDKTEETIDDMVRTAPNEYAPDEPNEVESLPPPIGLSPDVTVNNDANDPNRGHDPSEPGWQSMAITIILSFTFTKLTSHPNYHILTNTF